MRVGVRVHVYVLILGGVDVRVVLAPIVAYFVHFGATAGELVRKWTFYSRFGLRYDFDLLARP